VVDGVTTKEAAVASNDIKMEVFIAGFPRIAHGSLPIVVEAAPPMA
jgi:hypothetical protein